MKPSIHTVWGVLGPLAWLAAVAADHTAVLASSEFLERAGGGLFAGIALDVLVVLPVLAMGAGAIVMLRRSPMKSRGLAVGAVAATALLVSGAYFAERDLILHRFATVAPAVLYRSGQTNVSKLDGLIADHEVRTVLFLREPGEALSRERALADQRGVRFEHIPMTRPKAAAARFLEVMDDPDNLPVLIHCEYGIARTGLLSAVYRMEYEGWDNQRALDEARWFAGFDGFGEASQKRAFLLDYDPRENRRSDATGGRVPAP